MSMLVTYRIVFIFRELCVYLPLLLVLITPSLGLAAQDKELSGVKSEISRQQKELSKQGATFDSLQSELKKQEITISGLEKQINETQRKLSSTNSAIKTLELEITELNKQKSEQSLKLKQLINTYYVTQNSSGTSSLLEDSSENDRISQYYQYLAKERSATIAALNKTHQTLSNKQQLLVSERNTTDLLLVQQTQERDKLKETQNKRRATLGKIKSDISSDKVYLAELQRNEARLKAEIAKAAKRNAVPMNGLQQVKAQMSWPLNGTVLHRFGTKQTGQIDWKGIVISAHYGQHVQAAYPGTVVFSEYLRGYGLVVLLDHGKGDMTLYGFNQSLLKKEGDKVSAGETIALAGDTGGQPQPSLYFEIRRNSKAQNPLLWLKN
jgi:septal ring factor EnvC (AmiA/AmiB activator)